MKEGLIEPILDIDEYLNRTHGIREKLLVLLLFLTGARSSELVLMKSNDIVKDHSFLAVTIRTMKRGRTRILRIPLKSSGVFPKYARVLLHLVNEHFLDGQLLLPGFSNVKIHRIITRVSDGDINPYFLRHNIMSILSMNGASINQIQYWKGAKDIKSVQPYVHISMAEQIKTGTILQNI